jgi:hypothetical protein
MTLPELFSGPRQRQLLMPGTANASNQLLYAHGHFFRCLLQNDCATVLTVASSLDPKEQSITPRITLQVGYLELRSSVGYNLLEVGESS